MRRKTEKELFANLKKLDTDTSRQVVLKKVKGLVIKAFKRRFEPKSVNDKITLKTFKISSF